MSSVAISPQTKPVKANPKIIVACPHCQTRYQVSATMQGKKAVCRKCQQPMPIRSIAATRPAVATQPGKPIIKSPSVAKLPNGRPAGLGLILKSSGDIVAALNLAIVFPIALFVDSNLLAITFYTLMGVGAVLNLVGLGMCFAVPHQTKSRTPLIGSVFFAALFGVMFYGVGAGNVLAIPFAAACYFLFMLFLFRTSTYFGRSDFAQTAKVITWVHFACTAVGIGLQVWAMNASSIAVAKIATLLLAFNLIVLAINMIACTILQMRLGIHMRKVSKSA